MTTRTDAATLRQMATDPAAFRARVLIDCDGTPTPLARVIEPWQAADFESMDAALRCVIGQRVTDPCLRHWLERPRGHSKTSDIALAVTWLMFSSRRSLRGVVAAADQDQAQLLKDAVERLVRLNIWLNDAIEIQRWKIVNKHSGSECAIITSDAPSSYGLLLDFVVCDETTHWPKRDLFDSLLSTAAKRKHCLVMAIMNAGFMTSWCWPMREAIRQDPSWRFTRLEGPCASWITADRLAEQERLLPAIAYARLWLNEWATGSGDALADEDITAAIHEGDMDPTRVDDVCVAGLDIGLKRDATGYVVLAKNRAGFLRLLRVRRWQAERGGTVDLEGVERAIVADAREFRLRRVACDPNEAGYLMQRLKRDGVRVEERKQVGVSLVSQAAALVTAFRDQRIKIPADEILLRELRTARVEERSYGVRLTADRTDAGHGDVVTALSIALAEIKDVQPLATVTTGWQPQADVVDSLRSGGLVRRGPATQLQAGRGRLGARLF